MFVYDTAGSTSLISFRVWVVDVADMQPLLRRFSRISLASCKTANDQNRTNADL